MRRNRHARALYWLWSVAALTIAPQAHAWSNAGRQAIVEIAFQFDPSLRSRVETILQNLPNSPDWVALAHSGQVAGKGALNPSPDAWAETVCEEPNKAATFLDWAKQFKAYRADRFDEYRTYGLNYDMGQPSFAKPNNAITRLQEMENEVKTGSGGTEAWALLWVLSLVGDLHQPLYTTFRDKPGTDKPDGGGLNVTYRGKSLRQYWDDLPNEEIGGEPRFFAEGLVQDFRLRPLSEQDAIIKQAHDQDVDDWVEEGRAVIRKIGYPTDKKVPVYSDAALDAANDRMLLAGARLAVLLRHLLEN